MSGMFQRIARRHTDRSDEPVAVENADASAREAPVADRVTDVPSSEAEPGEGTAGVPTPESKPGEATADLPVIDAPTERIEAVAPAPGSDQPTTFQPVAATPDRPTAHQANVPPPAMDLTTRLPATPAESVAVAPVAAPAPAQADPATTETVVAEPTARRPGFRARVR